MVQTDPIIDERDSPENSHIPIPSEHFLDQETRKSLERLPVPINEKIAVLELPMPQEPEDDGQDWEESTLYGYIKRQQTKQLNKKGVPSDYRPVTPTSQRGMTPSQQVDYNIK